MRLKELLNGIYHRDISPLHQEYLIKSISHDSRNCKNGSLFVALKGTERHGANYISHAIQNGAVCIVHQQAEKLFLPSQVCSLEVDDLRSFLFSLANRFYHYSSNRVECIGITGTNGKTTTAYLIESIFRAAGKKCGVIGTVDCHFENQRIDLSHTTPDIIQVLACLDQMRQAGVSHCAMEVSSHALDQDRLTGLSFCVGVFTNLTQDHLDYHLTMEKYFLAKSKLFQSLQPKDFAIINVDDSHAAMLIDKTKAKIIRYGIHCLADIMAREIMVDIRGCKFHLIAGEQACEINSLLVGEHNLYNILAAASACQALGMAIDDIRIGIENLTYIPGRLERVPSEKKFHIFVDYAHTYDALRNVLRYLKGIAKSRIFLVFGCGGNRDKGKRAQMGQVAGRFADFTIITSDNPRDEDPDEIISQIACGFEQKNYLIVPDRRRAITRALNLAKNDDIILIAGKGHENYQIIKGKKIYFNDRNVIEEILLCLQ